jgi:hypothetical protein
MSLSTIAYDLSGISSSSFYLSTIQVDVSGNIPNLSTVVNDLSGVTNPGFIYNMATPDLSGGNVSNILSIDDLLNSHEAVSAKESTDRNAVVSFTTLSMESLKPTLYRWAGAGFPGGYIVATLNLSPPAMCSDGVSRALTFYFEWLLATPIATWLQGLEALTKGMLFTFSHDGANTITLHVSRA